MALTHWVIPPNYDYVVLDGPYDPQLVVGWIQTTPRPGLGYTYNPIDGSWIPPITYYAVDSITGAFLKQLEPLEPAPEGYTAITTPPPDPWMTWNFNTEIWEWSVYALKKIAYNTQVEKLKEDFTWNSRQVTPGCPAMKFNVYAAAVSEDPTQERTVYFKADFNPTEDYVILTNAEIIDLFDTYWGVVGKVNNIFADVIQDIENNVITDGASFYTAWATYDANYDDTRTKLPTLAELAEAVLNFTTPSISDIEGLQDALDSKSTFNGDYNTLTNKPTLVSTFSNDAGYIDAVSLANALSIYAQAAGVSAALANKEPLGAAATAQAYAIQRANHTGTQEASTISDLAPVATSGDYNDLVNTPALFSGNYNDLTGKPTLFSGDYNSLTNKPSVGKAVVNTTIKSNSFYVTKSGTVSSGTVVFHFTDNGQSTGNALFTEIDTSTVNPIVNDGLASYQYSWAWSNSNKTLTITVNKLTTANLLTGLLGQVAADGAVVNVTVFGR